MSAYCDFSCLIVMSPFFPQTISAYSGHYRPSDDSLDTFLSFLRENAVNLDDVEVNHCVLLILTQSNLDCIYRLV